MIWDKAFGVICNPGGDAIDLVNNRCNPIECLVPPGGILFVGTRGVALQGGEKPDDRFAVDRYQATEFLMRHPLV